MNPNQTSVEFWVDGAGPYSLEQMLETNESDTEMCAWLWTAKAFDRFPALQIVECRPALKPLPRPIRDQFGGCPNTRAADAHAARLELNAPRWGL